MDTFDEILEECRRSAAKIYPDQPEQWENMAMSMLAPAILGFLSCFDNDARVLFGRYQQLTVALAAEQGFQFPPGASSATDRMNESIQDLQKRAAEHSQILNEPPDADT